MSELLFNNSSMCKGTADPKCARCKRNLEGKRPGEKDLLFPPIRIGRCAAYVSKQ